MTPDPSLINEIDGRMLKLGGEFMRDARLQGLHFKYVATKGELLIETRFKDRFFYWLLCAKGMVLIDASKESKSDRRATIASTIKPKVFEIPND